MLGNVWHPLGLSADGDQLSSTGILHIGIGLYIRSRTSAHPIIGLYIRKVIHQLVQDGTPQVASSASGSYIQKAIISWSRMVLHPSGCPAPIRRIVMYISSPRMVGL